MTQIVTIHELSRHIQRVLHTLSTGQELLIVHNHVALARLTPIPQIPPEPPQPVVKSTTELLRHPLGLLGADNLSRILGLTLATFILQFPEGQFSPAVNARLAALSAAMDEQRLILPSPRIRAWWRRPHRELARHAPIDHLAFPWVSGDARSEQVFALIHRDGLVHRAKTLDARS
ncbi:hypothetical protein [Deinococcus sp. QL22]|uniref:hypothetical protein n=1 Tax=Deinococcus sp. QL22 TaxID=2939437 RepID=UPI002017F1F6|nr:hypothetical protein [Deinococcus sp. QL22]UQN10218.1 hypothetical protein M1R55_27975 [Deinococcus sp. QL22]